MVVVDANRAVPTVNLADVAPAGTVTEAGTMNTIQSGVLKVTTAPPGRRR
jgi:hypothetical protein